MVLELDVPHEATLAALGGSATGFLTYALSFVYIGIYWNNHHHMFQVTRSVNGAVLWANLHLLFWLSLYPFSTAWMDETDFAQTPMVVYGINLLAAAVAFTVLQQSIFRGPGGDRLRAAVGRNRPGTVSLLLYLLGIGLAFVNPWPAVACYVAVAVIWLVPDRRVERFVMAHQDEVL